MKDWSESGPHISTWLRGNIWHEFNGDSKMSVATLAGTDAVYLSSSHDGTWGEIEAGISGTITDSTKLFASASYSHSFGNDNKGSDWGGQIGFTYNW